MYDAVADPYCYEGTTVLRNVPGLRDQAALDAFETAATAQRSDEPLPPGRLSVRHYQAIHRHLFQDVYAWAGKFRTVRIAKDGSMFCYPENIEREMRNLFAKLKRDGYLRQLSKEQFAIRGAHFVASLNAIHPFREGNGRTQMSFFVLLASRTRHPLDIDKLVPERFLGAMVKSFFGDERALVEEIEQLTTWV
jgi:cell filamentation protein